MVRDYKPPFAVILTGVPKSATYEVREWVGNTFTLAVTPLCACDCIYSWGFQPIEYFLGLSANYTATGGFQPIALPPHSCVWVFDSHKHPRSPTSTRGMVLARIAVDDKSDLRTCIKVALDWVFDTNLYETNCHDAFAECTVVVAGQTKAVAATSPIASQTKAVAATRPIATAASSKSPHQVAASESVAERVPLECTPCGSIAPRILPSGNETDEDHRRRHPKKVRSCTQCTWMKNGSAWQILCAHECPATKQMVCPIQRAPPETGGLFRVGCSDCAAYLKHLRAAGGAGSHPRVKTAFARFQISARSSFQRCRFQEHCKGEFHLKALAWKYPGKSVASGTATGEGGKYKEGDGDKDKELQGAPHITNFIWALILPHGSSSNASLATFMRLNTLDVQNAGQKLDRHHTTVSKYHRSAGAHLHNVHCDVVARSSRLAFAFDDMDRINTLRCRVSYMTPKVGSVEFLADVAMDFGFEVEDHARAVTTSLQRVCRKVQGKQIGAIKYEPLSAEKWKHVQKIAFAGASDGLLCAVKAIQKLKDDGELNLRYQFRDTAHAGRTIMTGVLRNTLETNELEALFISGEKSFCKRVRYSRLFRGIWRRKQRTDFDSLVGICEDCSYAPHRFDSEKGPRMTLIDHMGAVIETLVEVANDPNPNHKEDAAWAKKLVRVASGVEGFEKLLRFAVDTDFVVHVGILIRVADKTNKDSTVTYTQCQECLSSSEALFKDLGVFRAEASALFVFGAFSLFYLFNVLCLVYISIWGFGASSRL